jgi:hypothetical protein
MKILKPYAYIGICPNCNMVHAMCVSTLRERKYVAKEVYDMVLAGLQVKHVTLEEANEHKLSVCKFYKPHSGGLDT